MKITFWGTRGSIPVSGARFLRHGGATTCLEIETEEERVIIDCGSGLAELGRAKGFSLDRANLYQTHMHWDHVQGFPFFSSLFNPEAEFSMHAVPREGSSLHQVLGEQMRRPTFPIGLDIIPAKLSFHDLVTEGGAEHGDLQVSWTEVCHPSGSSAFRIEHEGGGLVFSGDVEAEQGCKDKLIEFARDAQVLVMDAQYFPEEYAQRVGFGHSTPIDAVEVALAAGVERLIMTHHDPAHDDLTLARKLKLARDAAGSKLLVENAFDRMEIEVPPAPTPCAVAS